MEEEERNWRLERNESNNHGKAYHGDGYHDNAYHDHSYSESNGAESASKMADSPTSPSSPASPVGPALKFNGVPVTKPVPHPPSMPVQYPVAAPPMPMPMMGDPTISTSITAIGIDTDWNIGDILCLLYDCTCQCQRTLACIVNSHEAAMRVHQIRMLQDCCDVCHLTWCFLQRDSRYSLKLLKLCAQVCEACADACALHMDMDSQRCVATCLRCAAACRAFIAAHL